ncbi:MAG: phosphoadenosine phosphosulfate reductase family protein [Sphingomonadales bacterium]|nr:phosphoadenosine phosphosulfate reductase family protein [Sphingomonadales bacterium]
MLAILRQYIPADQLLVIHAHLPGVEWPGTIEHIRATTKGLPLIVCEAVKTFFQMVERRGMFPSPQQRQCTSDLKRGPIEREIRRYLKANPRFGGLVVNCMGLRAQESPKRAKAQEFKFNARNSKAGREWYDWLPVQDLTKDQVFAVIAAAGEKPHWAYGAGMTRLSCCFCIMASRQDLCTAARLRPKLYRRYVGLESRIGHTMMMPAKGEAPKYLEEITGISA